MKEKKGWVWGYRFRGLTPPGYSGYAPSGLGRKIKDQKANIKYGQ
jgi:hypothetical protein